MKSKKSKDNNNRRLHPYWYDSNYYGLMKLSKLLVFLIKKYLMPLGSSLDLLDFGCGTMPYKELFIKYVRSYNGADIKLNQARSYDIDLKTNRINAEDSSFDLVLSTQVLEHTSSPVDYLKEAFRVTKNDGFLIISTHGLYPYHPDPNDYWRWTASGLNKILNDNSWKPLETIGIIGYLAAALSLFQYSISYRLPKYLRIPFEVIMQRLIWLSDSFSSKEGVPENSVIYLIIAQKRNYDNKAI